MKTIKIKINFTAISALSHMGATHSTSSLFHRDPILVDGEVINVPCVTANSLRGKLRRCGAHHLVETLGVKMSREAASRHLFGGATKSGAAKIIDLGAKQAERQLNPLLSIFGYGLSDLSGKLTVGPLWAVCQETAKVGLVWHDKNLPLADDLVSIQSFTRSDSLKDDQFQEVFLALVEGDPDADSAQMRYDMEVLVPGARLETNLTITLATETEFGALMACFKKFSGHAFLGGARRIGMGAVCFGAVITSGGSGGFGFNQDGWNASGDCQSAIEAYEAHLRERADQLKEALND